MIKIIKQGTRQKLECDNCGCMFSFEDEDVKRDCVRMRRFIECPQCRAKIYIADANLEKRSPEPLDDGTGLNE